MALNTKRVIYPYIQLKFITNKVTTKHSTNHPMPATAQLLESSLLLIWNDRNADTRLVAMQHVYTPDMHFYESNTGEAIIGQRAINELITKLQADWPVEFLFTLNQPAQVNHNTQIASWQLGPAGAPPIATGMDVAITEGELIQSLYLFLDV